MEVINSIVKSLNFDANIFLMQFATFVLLLIFMNLVYWKPVLQRVQGRHEAIEQAHNSVENTRKEMETLRNDYQSRMAQIEAEARNRIQTAIKEAQTERERLIAAARAEADATLREGVAQLEREKDEALVNLRTQIATLALDVAGKALGPSADKAALNTLIANHMQSGDPARN